MPLENPHDALAELRWTADRIVMSPTWGERVWLKQIDGGLTDGDYALELADFVTQNLGA